MTRGVPSSLTVAKTLPAYIGRLKVVRVDDAGDVGRHAGAEPRGEAGQRSLPIAVAVATTSSTPFCFTTSASAAV